MGKQCLNSEWSSYGSWSMKATWLQLESKMWKRQLLASLEIFFWGGGRVHVSWSGGSLRSQSSVFWFCRKMAQDSGYVHKYSCWVANNSLQVLTEVSEHGATPRAGRGEGSLSMCRTFPTTWFSSCTKMKKKWTVFVPGTGLFDKPPNSD